MSRYYSYLNSATAAIQQYKGGEPLSSFLKKFFSAEKKYGSRDRKQISHLCYCYFRLGKALQDLTIEERIMAGFFLCSNEPNDMLAALRPGWNERTELPLEEKVKTLNDQSLLAQIFPWKDLLSPSIEYSEFCKSFLIQPSLFIRLRPGKRDSVIGKLTNKGIDFEEINSACLALPNSTNVDVIDLDKEAVVQDLSSQSISTFYQYCIDNLSSMIKCWDCCAASGGKALLLHDIDPTIELTVSDVRKSILVNLASRFEKAGIKNYRSLVIDLSQENIQGPLASEQFPMIVADVPCTGSGTWSRTPEQLYYFDAKKIDEYCSLQRSIILNVIPKLAPGGFLVYSTCSVFRKENEEMVEFIQSQFQLELLRMEVFKGYNKKADSLFAALFRRPKVSQAP